MAEGEPHAWSDVAESGTSLGTCTDTSVAEELKEGGKPGQVLTGSVVGTRKPDADSALAAPGAVWGR